jgi:hypothetical protein
MVLVATYMYAHYMTHVICPCSIHFTFVNLTLQPFCRQNVMP